MSKEEQAVFSLIDKISHVIEKKYYMIPCGSVISMPGGDVRKLGLNYHIQGPRSKEQLRELLINLANEFLSIINFDESVRPYLTKYPFDINNVQITLFLDDAKGYEINNPNIGTASIRSNKLFYKYWEKPNKISSLVKTSEESYEEASKRLSLSRLYKKQ